MGGEAIRKFNPIPHFGGVRSIQVILFHLLFIISKQKCVSTKHLSRWPKMSLCKGISEKIEVTTIAMDETTILEIIATIWPRRVFRNNIIYSTLCLLNHFVTIGECLFSSRMSLAMPYIITCITSKVRKVSQIPITIQGKTSFCKRRFH